MALEKTSLPAGLESSDEEISDDAPYGYKADGTPKKRPGRPKGSSGTSGGTGSKKYKSDAVRQELADKIVEYLGPPLGFASPLALGVLEERADKTSNALCTLAATRPRIARIIDGMLSGGASIDLVITGMALVTAIMVETSRIDPQSAASHVFGVDKVYAEIYGAEFSGNGYEPQSRGLLGQIRETESDGQTQDTL